MSMTVNPDNHRIVTLSFDHTYSAVYPLSITLIAVRRTIIDKSDDSGILADIPISSNWKMRPTIST